MSEIGGVPAYVEDETEVDVREPARFKVGDFVRDRNGAHRSGRVIRVWEHQRGLWRYCTVEKPDGSRFFAWEGDLEELT